MANNCENRVEIYGDVENLKNLHGKLKGVNSLHLDTYSTLFESVNEDYSWVQNGKN